MGLLVGPTDSIGLGNLKVAHKQRNFLDLLWGASEAICRWITLTSIGGPSVSSTVSSDRQGAMPCCSTGKPNWRRGSPPRLPSVDSGCRAWPTSRHLLENLW